MKRDLLLSVLILSSLFGSDTFWFSYRSVTLDKVLVYEEKNISPLLVPFIGKRISTCRVKISGKKSLSKLQLLNKNFDNLLPCFYKTTVKVTSQSQVRLNSMRDEVELVIAPVRFIVDFKDDFAKITILK